MISKFYISGNDLIKYCAFKIDLKQNKKQNQITEHRGYINKEINKLEILINTTWRQRSIITNMLL